MWKAHGKTTTLQLFLDSLSPKTEKLSLEGTMDLSRDRLILELGLEYYLTLQQTTQFYLLILQGKSKVDPVHKQVPGNEDVWESGGIAPHINLGTI
jgi:hypothetical protein